MAVGVNYYPIKQIVVKAEYSNRFLKKLYNNEPSINIGIAYEGWFDLGHKTIVAQEQSDVQQLNDRINQLQEQINELKKKNI
jgi:TolA-binding protein